MSYVAGQVEVDGPECANVWRTDAGDVRGTVNIAPGLRNYMTFTSTADARAVAAACLECAEAMERLEAGGSEDLPAAEMRNSQRRGGTR